MAPSQIPVVDLQNWFCGVSAEREQVCDQVRQVCHDIGFFYVINHGIETSTSAAYLKALRAFFALPLAQRQAIDKCHSPHFRGWEQLGSELTNNQIDYREQLDIGVEAMAIENPEPWYLGLIGPNQWPAESALPGFRNTVTDYFNQLAMLSNQILRIMSCALGLDETYFENVFGREPAPYMKLIRYPQTRSGSRGVGVHKDSGFLTLLLQDEVPGLEAKGHDDRWYPVDPLPGSLVVNTGELLQLLTRNYFIATPHRVINRRSEDRYSSAFFYSPDLRVRLEPLPLAPELIGQVQRSPRHRDQGLMASRAEMAKGVGVMQSQVKPTVFGEKYWQRWVRSYPDIAHRFYPDAPT